MSDPSRRPEPPAWWWAWARHHAKVIPRSDWPDFHSPFWSELWELMQARRVDEQTAYAVTKRMFAVQPDFLGEHPARIVDVAKVVWRECNADRPATPEPPRRRADDFDRACEEHWALLDEVEREAVRQLVRERAPFLAGRPKAQEIMARAWAYAPETVIGPPPAPSGRHGRRGPSRPFAK